MSDFVDLCKTLLKAYTESQNDTSDDDVLKELPPIFLTTRAEFFDDDHECNRAVLVRLKLEGKLEHKFNTSTAFAYITSTRDALEQCKRGDGNHARGCQKASRSRLSGFARRSAPPESG